MMENFAYICGIKWNIIRPCKIVQNVQNEHALFEIKSVNISWVFNFASFEIFVLLFHIILHFLKNWFILSTTSLML